MSESYKEEIKDAKIIIKQKRIRKMPNATVNKLTEMDTDLSMTTLNINGLNSQNQKTQTSKLDFKTGPIY